DQAFVTLATSDVYFQGALVLGHSLRHHRTSRQLVILTTPQVSSFMRVVLRCVFDEVIEVKEIDSRDAAHLALMKRPELGITFTKLHCWALIKYTKCVFLDADTLVLCNVDELFDREEISAAPDPGWPDCFNTGVFVFRPSLQTYNRLFQFAVEHGSFDGGDQGLLNSFFNDWAVKDIDKHLPFIYNLSSSIAYTYLPAFRHFGHEAKIVHFLGPVKPWHYKYNPQTRSVFQEFGSPSGHHHIHFLNLWWEVYNTQILPLMMQHNDTWGSRALQQHKLDLAASVSELSLGTEPEPYDPEGRQKWEEGHMDYMGKDSFENIKKKLDRFLEYIEYLIASDHTDARPNFIVMMVDDLGIGDIGCYGNNTVRTPNIDRLAQEGVKLTQHIAAGPLCTPSRAAFMTGRYPIRSGKWHLGVNCDSRNDNCHHPVNHGFDYFYGLPFTLFNDCKPGEGTDILADVQAVFRQASQVLGLALLTLLIARLTGFFLVSWKLIVLLTITVLVGFCSWYVPFALVQTWNCIIMKNQDVIEQPMTLETLPQRLLNEAEYFIERNQQRPFFLFISFAHVHTPLFTSKDFMGKSQHGLYGDNVEEVDWMVGGKGMGGWEGGIRVPGIFRWPGTLSPGSVIDEPTSLMDVFPTLVNLAGGELPKDSLSLLSHFESERSENPALKLDDQGVL
ncbi:Glycogenin-1, partial [Acipenser ruthenus]